MEIIARIGHMRAANLPEVLSIVASLAYDIEREIARDHASVTTTQEFLDYQAAVTILRASLRTPDELGDLISNQGDVNEAARRLAMVELQDPVADPGRDQSVSSSEGRAVVNLDASASQAFDGRVIARYHWSQERP